jgi:hypothetical protein
MEGLLTPPEKPPKKRVLTLDGVPSIDVRKWPGSGILGAPSPFADSITFVIDAIDLARTRKVAIGVTIRGNIITAGVEVELAYPNDAKGVARRHVATALDTTTPRFGGQRLWIVCPCCRTRAGVLYFFDDTIRCARCARQVRVYGQQMATPQSQHVRRAIELRRTLGADDFAADYELKRPKGMHWTTFWRVVDRINYHERQAKLLAYQKLHRGRP